MATTRTRSGDGHKDADKLKLKTHHARASSAGGAAAKAGQRPKKPRPRVGPPRGAAPSRAFERGDLSERSAGHAPEARPASAGPVKASRKAPPEVSLASDDARRVAIAIAGAALEKKAVGLEILDVAGKVDYADFLVLMSGRSDRQVAALAEGIQEALAKMGRRPLSIEGMAAARWVLMDFGDVVVHVLQEEARTMYDLEGLWVDAGRLPVPHADVP